MKILVAAHVPPWPAWSGAQIRVANCVRALAQIADVDVFSFRSGIDSPDVDSRRPDAKDIKGIRVASRPSTSYGVSRRLRWMILGRLPYELGTRDYSSVRSVFLDWVTPPYDLAWYVHSEMYVALGDLIDAPRVVDLDDLDDFKTVGRVRAKRDDIAKLPLKRRLAIDTLAKLWGSKLHGRIDARRWRTLHERIACSVEAVTVCSALDEARLGASNSAVIPNGYPPPRSMVGRIAVDRPPTLLMVGALTYTPNADAARFFVRDVLPRIRSRMDDIRVRFVGGFDHRADDLRGAGVTLTGRVEDIEAELARADVVIVPHRYGGGTRIKILEAFAHGIPVVSTSLGSEGLETTHGTHLLIADDPARFAWACIQLISDLPLRRRLSEAAKELYEIRYRTDVVGRSVIELVERITSATGSGRSLESQVRIGAEGSTG